MRLESALSVTLEGFDLWRNAERTLDMLCIDDALRMEIKLHMFQD